MTTIRPVALTLALLAMCPCGALAQSFLPRTDYPLGTNVLPTQVVTGDIDGDGFVDLVTSNSASNDVRVLRNNGNGTFGVPSSTALPDIASGVTLCDMDNDGDLDAAVTQYVLPGSIKLLRNVAGTFAVVGTMAAGERPAEVTCCDLDGLFGPDLAVATFDSSLPNNEGEVHVFLNSGSFQFDPAGVYPVGRHPFAIQCCDVDASQTTDLVVGNDQAGAISILRNIGGGTFLPAEFHGAGLTPTDLACCDINGDCYPDIVVGDRSGTDLYLLTNDGTGQFPASATSTSSGGVPMSVACGDMDCDGDVDIVAANNASPAAAPVSVLINTGTGSFPTWLGLPGAVDARSVVLADLDRTGGLDITTGNFQGQSVSVFLQTAPFPPPHALDHFLCYGTPPAPWAATNVTIADMFESGTYQVLMPKFMCAPADKNYEGLCEPPTHLTAYRLKGVHVERQVELKNQFGRFLLETRARQHLMVPSGKTLLPDPPPAQPDPTTQVDHYRCVLLKGGKLPHTAVVVDQFGSRIMRRMKPWMLCVATDKNGEGVKDPDRHLTCYKATTKKKHQPNGVQIANQLGNLSWVQLKKESLLCLPSRVKDPCPTACIGGPHAGSPCTTDNNCPDGSCEVPPCCCGDVPARPACEIPADCPTLQCDCW